MIGHPDAGIIFSLWSLVLYVFGVPELQGLGTSRVGLVFKNRVYLSEIQF